MTGVPFPPGRAGPGTGCRASVLARLTAIITPDVAARVARGDPQAFEQLYDQSNRVLFSLALRIVGDRGQTAELLQQVYLEVWRTAARSRHERGSPRAWLVTLTRSRAIDLRRSRASREDAATRSMEESPAGERLAVDPSPFESAADGEVKESVQKAFARLPVLQREALKLAYYEGLSHSEIAAQLAQPVGTIKTRIRSGLSKLKEDLRALWERA